MRRWSAHMHDIIDDPAYVALAESLVDEALAPLVAVTPPSVLPELRDFLVDELLCTEYGQAELLLLLPRDAPVQSDAAILRERVVTQVRARSDHARKHLG
ncbi:MAG: hypothetical protein HOV80_07160 [Polyangiaceae bacterium]|nr:hypothetical protein [Polyangiaceae bacterium]